MTYNLAYGIRFNDGIEASGDWSWEEYFVSECGLDYWKYKWGEQELTRRNLESHLDKFISRLESDRDYIEKKGLYKDNVFRFDSIATGYQILAVLILETGSILPDKVKNEALKWTEWDYDKQRLWQGKSTVESRKFLLKRFRTIVRNYTPDHIYHFYGGVLEPSELDDIPYYEIEVDGLDNFHKVLENNEYKSISSLSLRECELKVLPNNLFLFINLKYLDLAGNYLTHISPKIQRLQKLEILYLAKNMFISLPKEIGTLKELKVLDLSMNNLESIPDEIGNLMTLRELGLHSNKLKELPLSLGSKPLLRVISIIGNSISYEELEKTFSHIMLI